MDSVFFYALSLIPNLGCVLQKRLVSHFGSIQEVFNSKKSDLTQVFGFGEHSADNFLKNKDASLKKSEELLTKAGKIGVSFVDWGSANYPFRLRQIPDPPMVLFYKGDINLLSKKYAIAIVGSRGATQYGFSVTQQFIEGVEHLSPLIISGLAAGIDILAHKTALSKSLATLAVLPGSLDKIYPAKHFTEAERLINQGLLLSEHPIKKQPNNGDFPIRNRLIAGLADVVFIPEAGLGSGSLITASLANQYDREVFAVPGDLNKRQSMGCNHLIANNGARLYYSVEQLLLEMKWDDKKTAEAKISFDWSMLDENQLSIAKLLIDKGSLEVEVLAMETEIGFGELAGILLSMELMGWIKSMPGNRYEWKG